MGELKINLFGPRNVPRECLVRSVDCQADSLSWFLKWLPQMYDLAGNKLHPDSHWDCSKIWSAYDSSQEHQVKILECCDDIQGYFVQQLNYRGIAGDECIYIPFLAAAPWNRRSGGQQPRFLGVGKSIIACASIYGLSIFDSPVLELHALRTAERFYEHLGFEKAGSIKDGMHLYRLDEKAAYDLLRSVSPFLAK